MFPTAFSDEEQTEHSTSDKVLNYLH